MSAQATLDTRRIRAAVSLLARGLTSLTIGRVILGAALIWMAATFFSAHAENERNTTVELVAYDQGNSDAGADESDWSFSFGGGEHKPAAVNQSSGLDSRISSAATVGPARSLADLRARYAPSAYQSTDVPEWPPFDGHPHGGSASNATGGGAAAEARPRPTAAAEGKPTRPEAATTRDSDRIDSLLDRAARPSASATGRQAPRIELPTRRGELARSVLDPVLEFVGKLIDQVTSSAGSAAQRSTLPRTARQATDHRQTASHGPHEDTPATRPIDNFISDILDLVGNPRRGSGATQPVVTQQPDKLREDITQLTKTFVSELLQLLGVGNGSKGDAGAGQTPRKPTQRPNLDETLGKFVNLASGIVSQVAGKDAGMQTQQALAGLFQQLLDGGNSGGNGGSGLVSKIAGSIGRGNDRARSIGDSMSEFLSDLFDSLGLSRPSGNGQGQAGQPRQQGQGQRGGLAERITDLTNEFVSDLLKTLGVSGGNPNGGGNSGGNNSRSDANGNSGNGQGTRPATLDDFAQILGGVTDLVSGLVGSVAGQQAGDQARQLLTAAAQDVLDALRASGRYGQGTGAGQGSGGTGQSGQGGNWSLNNDGQFAGTDCDGDVECALAHGNLQTRQPESLSNRGPPQLLDDPDNETQQALNDRLAAINGQRNLATAKSQLAAKKIPQASYDKQAAAQQALQTKAAQSAAQLDPYDAELLNDVVAGQQQLGTAKSKLDAAKKQLTAGKITQAAYDKQAAAYDTQRDQVYAQTAELRYAAGYDTAAQANPGRDGAGAACSSHGAFAQCSTAAIDAKTGQRSHDQSLCLLGISSCAASSKAGDRAANAFCDPAKGCGTSAKAGAVTANTTCGAGACSTEGTTDSHGADTFCRARNGCTENGKRPDTPTQSGGTCTEDCALAGFANASEAGADCQTRNGTCDTHSTGRRATETAPTNETPAQAAERSASTSKANGEAASGARCEASAVGCDVTTTARAGVDPEAAEAKVRCAQSATGCRGSATTTANGKTQSTQTTPVIPAVAGDPATGQAAVPATPARTNTDSRTRTGTARCEVASGTCTSSSGLGDEALAHSSVNCDEAKGCTGKANTATAATITTGADGKKATRKTDAHHACTAGGATGRCANDASSTVDNASWMGQTSATHGTTQPDSRDGSARHTELGQGLTATSKTTAVLACGSMDCKANESGATSGEAAGDVKGTRDSDGVTRCEVHGVNGTCGSAVETAVAFREAKTREDGTAIAAGVVSESHADAQVRCQNAKQCGGKSYAETSALDTGVSKHRRGSSDTAECTVRGGGCLGQTSSDGSSAPDYVELDPKTGKPLPGQPTSGSTSTSRASASVDCRARDCTGTAHTAAAAWDGPGKPRTSEGTVGCAAGAATCQVQTLSDATTGPGAALTYAGNDTTVNTGRLGTGPSAASTIGGKLTGDSGKLTGTVLATNPTVSKDPRGNRAEGSCTGATGGTCTAVINGAAASSPDADVIRPMVQDQPSQNAITTNTQSGAADNRPAANAKNTTASQTDGQGPSGQPGQNPNQPATAPGSSANTGGAGVPGASSWTTAWAALTCTGDTTCKGTPRSEATGVTGPNHQNGGSGTRGPPVSATGQTSSSCDTIGAACQAISTASAASGQVVADILTEQYKAATDAEAAIKKPLTTAEVPLTWSQSESMAQCAATGCQATATGRTTVTAGTKPGSKPATSTTTATCTAGCVVTSNASATVDTHNSGILAGKGKSLPGTSGQGSTSSQLACPKGCAGSVTGSVTAGKLDSSTATARCTGAADCQDQLIADTSVGYAPSRKSTLGTAQTSAACQSESGVCSTTSKSTAPGNLGAANCSAKQCEADSRASLTNDAPEVTAGCSGDTSCTANSSGEARSGANTAKFAATCTAGANGRCNTGGQAAADPTTATAGATCTGDKNARCAYSYRAHAEAGAGSAGNSARASASGSGGGGMGGGGVATSATAEAGPGYAAASASCSGAANCRHHYAAHSEASASYRTTHEQQWASASASGSGGGGQGGGGVATSAQAKAGPGYAAGSASCSGAVNCSTSFAAHSRAAVNDPKAGFGWGHADCTGGGSAGGSCSTTAVAYVDSKGRVIAGADCSTDGGTCSQSFRTGGALRKSIGAKENGQVTAAADSACSGGARGGGWCMSYVSADARGYTKNGTVHRNGQAVAACAGSAGTTCSHHYSVTGDVELFRGDNLLREHTQCGSGGGAGSGGCGLAVQIRYVDQPDGSKMANVEFACAGPNCKGSFQLYLYDQSGRDARCQGTGTTGGGCGGLVTPGYTRAWGYGATLDLASQFPGQDTKSTSCRSGRCGSADAPMSVFQGRAPIGELSPDGKSLTVTTNDHQRHTVSADSLKVLNKNSRIVYINGQAMFVDCQPGSTRCTARSILSDGNGPSRTLSFSRDDVSQVPDRPTVARELEGWPSPFDERIFAALPAAASEAYDNVFGTDAHGFGGLVKNAGRDLVTFVAGLPLLGRTVVVDLGAELTTLARYPGDWSGRTFAPPGFTAPRPGESFSDWISRWHPLIGHFLVTPLADTGTRWLGMGNQLQDDYYNHPLTSLLTDITSVAIITAPISGALRLAAGRAASLADLARAAGESGAKADLWAARFDRGASFFAAPGRAISAPFTVPVRLGALAVSKTLASRARAAAAGAEKAAAASRFAKAAGRTGDAEMLGARADLLGARATRLGRFGQVADSLGRRGIFRTIGEVRQRAADRGLLGDAAGEQVRPGAPLEELTAAATRANERIRASGGTQKEIDSQLAEIQGAYQRLVEDQWQVSGRGAPIDRAKAAYQAAQQASADAAAARQAAEETAAQAHEARAAASELAGQPGYAEARAAADAADATARTAATKARELTIQERVTAEHAFIQLRNLRQALDTASDLSRPAAEPSAGGPKAGPGSKPGGSHGDGAVFDDPPSPSTTPGPGAVARRGDDTVTKPIEIRNNGPPGELVRVGNFASQVLAFEHYAKHVLGLEHIGNGQFRLVPLDMPEFTSFAEYVAAARAFMGGEAPEGVLEGIDQHGELVRLDPSSGYFGVRSADGEIRTFFRPSEEGKPGGPDDDPQIWYEHFRTRIAPEPPPSPMVDPFPVLLRSLRPEFGRAVGELRKADMPITVDNLASVISRLMGKRVTAETIRRAVVRESDNRFGLSSDGTTVRNLPKVRGTKSKRSTSEKGSGGVLDDTGPDAASRRNQPGQPVDEVQRGSPRDPVPGDTATGVPPPHGRATTAADIARAAPAYFEKVAAFVSGRTTVLDAYKDLDNLGAEYGRLVDEAVARYGLTPDEAHALFGYTTKLFYRGLNETLRAGGSTEANALAELLESGIQKLPRSGPVQYRGWRFADQAQREEFDVRFAPGKVVESENFWSSSPLKEDSYGADRNVVIYTTAARDISDLAFGVHFHHLIGKPEYATEAIIPPGVRFRVVGRDSEGRLILEQL